MRISFVIAVGALLLAPAPSMAQAARSQGSQGDPDIVLSAADEQLRQERIAVTGDLGFPPLPPVTLDSPRDSILYADRMDFRALSGDGDTLAATASGMVSYFIPKTLTGTDFPEAIEYRLPSTYDGQGAPHPLLVAMHGFGNSKSSCANQSTLDEEAEARGWIYMAPTGLDDQLFGSPICQQHIEVAIQYMLDNFNVDPDRIYMVGFSMGGGIALNFAARHRDPAGIMIAGVGSVSAGLDWTHTYNASPSDLKAWMENPYNFGGSPTGQPFRYQQASVLHNDPATYPVPGTILPDVTMGTNLGGLRTYITYDEADLIPGIISLNEQLDSFLSSLGATVLKTVKDQTVAPGPPGIPAPHSWYVLDEAECLDHLAGVVADRYPAAFEALQDEGGAVSWVVTTPVAADTFTHVDGSVDTVARRIEIADLRNAAAVAVHAQAAGLSGPEPVRVKLTNTGSGSVRVQLTDFSHAPSRLHQWSGGALVTLVDSDPATGSLFVDVGPGAALDVRVVHDPAWTTTLVTSPAPAPLGGTVDFSIDGPETSAGAFLVVSAQEFYTPVESLVMTAFPLPPCVILPLGLDGSGDVVFQVGVPGDPILSGLRLPSQVVTVGGGGALESVSNLWGLRFE